MTSLLDIWMVRREFLDSKSIEQVIAISGDGTLKDGNETSNNLREFIANIPSAKIEHYINECLNQSFQQSGLVLQDLVNETGRRIGFSVEHGYYRGGKAKIGFDGIWKAKDGYAFVIEVKTTDAYQLNLDIQAQYRKRLIESQRIDEKKSSILVVVGRTDTGGLEAQTRGSRHAWDVRIISVDALLKLMQIKENLSDASTVMQIQEVLKPLEYTRVDRLIDIIFTTSEDLQTEDVDDEVETDNPQSHKHSQSVPVKYHEECVNKVSERLKLPLIKQGRCTYTTADERIRVLCIVSKKYERGGAIRYWYAFHPNQKDFLDNGNPSYIALGCGTAEQVVLIPSEVFMNHLPSMRTTESSNRYYWHVEIFQKNNQFLLNRPTSEGIDVTEYKI